MGRHTATLYHTYSRETTAPLVGHPPYSPKEYEQLQKYYRVPNTTGIVSPDMAAIQADRDLLFGNNCVYIERAGSYEEALKLALRTWTKGTAEQKIAALSNYGRLDLSQLLTSAAASQNSELVNYLVAQEGIDVNAKRDDGSTALIAAARYYKTACRDQLNIIKILLDKGADINAKDYANNTAFKLAINHEKLSVAAILVKANYKIEIPAELFKTIYNKLIAIDCDAASKFVDSISANQELSNNIFMYAIEHHEVDVASMLVKTNCKINVSSSEVRDNIYTKLVMHDPMAAVAFVQNAILEHSRGIEDSVTATDELVSVGAPDFITHTEELVGDAPATADIIC